MEEKKSKRGGARVNAGRKNPPKTKPMALRLDVDLVEYLNTKSNKNRFINDSIRKEKEREK